MIDSIFRPSAISQPAPTRAAPAPCTPCVCPACGGLECLCRPRFFAGQLLTEEDLNRLDHYIVAKNKLHNRYLVGWGVVCGLEVVCNPCNNLVTVRPGYALSPCGEDIVVCRDEPVDVCELIKQCRPRRPDECEPLGAAGFSSACQDVTEQWYLGICYDEKPSRGIVPLKGSTEAPCCSRCSCGGSRACGCGCHARTNGGGKNGHRTAIKNLPAQCEPTIVCEGYRFMACPVPAKTREELAAPDPGALAGAIQACLKALAQCFGNPPDTADLNAVITWCCAVRDCLLDFVAGGATHNCALIPSIQALCPDPPQGTTGQAYFNGLLQRLAPIVVEFFRDCFCSALLPPCPGPSETSCVVLATVTVRKRDCHVLRVCDWEGRRTVVTFPNLGYWLSWIPFGRLLEEYIARLCCAPRFGTSVTGTPVTHG